MRAVRPRTPVLALAVLVVLLAGWPLAVPPEGVEPAGPAATQPTPASAKIVTVDRNSTEQLWPYTSRGRSFDRATLPINVVVLEDAAYVRHLLRSSTAAEWEVSEPAAAAAGTNDSAVESGVTLNGTRIEWSTARGSTRYSYLHEAGSGRGRWVEESYQLHDGVYLGSRYHLRLYEGGTGTHRWTAIQAHREHWDWFRLRHTVDSVDRAQDYVEGEFLGTWFLERAARDRFANGGALDADGWVTVIDLDDHGLSAPPLKGLALLGGAASLRRLTALDRQWALREARGRLDGRAAVAGYAPLVAALATLPLAVRVGGITLETTVPGLSPKVIAGALYPLLALGLPASTYGLARRLRGRPAGIVAVSSFGLGLLFDYLYLGIDALPIELVVHRALLLASIWCLAVGASRAPRRDGTVDPLVLLGAAGWFVGLVVPLLDVF